MRAFRSLFLISFVSLAAAPLFGYTIYLKDGSRLIAKDAYEIRGETAYITLQNGTMTSIAASEIDEERTRGSNDGRYGSAVVMEERGFRDITPESDEYRGQQQSLSEMIGSRRTSAASRPPAKRPVAEAQTVERLTGGGVDLRGLPRKPLSDMETAAEIQQVFRKQGVEQVLISQGTSEGRLLVDVTANSEAAVFRGLEAAALALLHARELAPGSSPVFELLLATGERDPAGQFVLTSNLARELADGAVETSTFFIENVRY